MASINLSGIVDGAVLTVINKRLRALRKKYNRFLQMEESLSQGKILNKEQEEALQSKASVMGAISELEKLIEPIRTAVTEEISKVECQCLEIFENEKFSMVEDIIKVLYFANMFNVPSPLDAYNTIGCAKAYERSCCLSYDVVTENSSDLLTQRDLSVIADLGNLLMSRPTNLCLNHQNALRFCVEQARLWLARSDVPIGGYCITYAGLREKLNKIMASDYFTTTPEMKAPVEVVAAAETYASFQVPVHGPVVSVDAPVQVQVSTVQYEQQFSQEELVVNPQGQGDGVYWNQTDPVEELAQGDEDENFAGFAGQTDSVVQSELEQDPQDFDKGQHYAPRRTFQNHRDGRGTGGGGRRGYPNGRGGRGGRGSYSNGRQYYDNPRNYYRGRGGRGGSYPGQGSYLVGDA